MKLIARIYTKGKSWNIFNKSPRSLDNTSFRIPIFLAPAFDYQADDEVILGINNHTRKQTSLGKSEASLSVVFKLVIGQIKPIS